MLRRVARVGDTLVEAVLYGSVGGEELGAALRLLGEAYADGGPGLVELRLYPDEALMEAVVSGLAAEAGVAAGAGFELFAHEAWSGVPRIHAVAPALLRGPMYEALFVHEAVHSLLHGSLEYYMAEPGVDAFLYYVAATTVKDLEVHGYMARRGLLGRLRLLQGYWLRVLGEGGYSVLDVLRALTVWAAVGEGPPGLLREALGARLEKLYAWMRTVLEEWQRKGTRPWAKRLELLGLLEGLGLALY